MEILQTIWTALTTENEGLVNIISIPFFFIDALVCMLLFTTILDIKTTTKQKIIYVFLLSFSCIICRLVIPNPYGIFINMLVWPLCVFFIFKTNVLKAILSEVLPYAISIILEITFEKIFFIFTQNSATLLLNIPIYRFAIVSLVYLSLFLLYILAKKHSFSISLLECMNKKSKKYIIINCILALLVIFTQFYLLNYYSDNFPLIVTLLNMLGLTAYFIVSIVSFTNITRLDATSTNLEEATLYNKTLQILYDNISAFKHDFGNIVQGIGGYVNTEDINGLKKYYSQLLEDCQRVNNLTTLSPQVINNPAIYNVLANKYHKADEKGIKINLEVFLDLNTLNIKIYEFTRVLGILMDNAIEATSECENKIINVFFKKKGHMQLLVIENTYQNKNVDTEEIYKKGFSTKKGNSGLGLWEVRQILKKNTNLNLYTTKNSEFFSQQFEIYTN